MIKENIWNNENLIKVLKENGVVIMPTDTIYGIVGRAQNVDVVNRIYNLKKRALEKPCIILIGNIGELEKFSIILSGEQKNKLKEYWATPTRVGVAQLEPTSIVLDCLDEKFKYLHRGTKTLAFRLPRQKSLQNLLKETGPFLAPSANPEGLPPAQNIFKAKKYFGDLVDLYINGGKIIGKASRIIKLHKDGSISILRE